MKKDEIKGLYFIVEGAVIEEYPDGHTEYHDTGELLNVAAHLLHKKIALTTLTTKNDALLTMFPYADMLSEMDRE